MKRKVVALVLVLGGCDRSSSLPSAPCVTTSDCAADERCLFDFGRGIGQCIGAPDRGEIEPPTRYFEALAHPDILFVVDDGPTMAEPQRRLVAGVDALAEELAWRHASGRIAVTTTSVDSPACASTGWARHGRLASTSCLDRLDRFVAPDGTDARDVCTAHCRHDTRQLGLEDHPWIDAATLPADVSLADALACLLPQGIAGCVHGAPLRAAELAWLRAAEPEDEAYGFVRDWFRAVVYVTDGMDCSATPDAGPAFDPDGDRALWPEGIHATAPPAVCLHGAATCTDPPGVECLLADVRPDGALAGPDDPTVLYPIDRYDLPPWVGLVRMYVTGVETTVEEPSRVSDPQFVAEHGIEAGCADGSIRAVPPLRMQTLEGATVSICAPTYDDWMRDLAAAGGTRALCLPSCLAANTRVRYQTSDADPIPVPTCVGDDPYRRLPVGARACMAWRTSPHCDDQELLLMRADPDEPGWFTFDPSLRGRTCD